MNGIKYCKERGIKLSEVARAACIHRSTLDRWYFSRPELFCLIVCGYLGGE